MPERNESQVNPGKGTQNTRPQKNDAVSKRIADQAKPDRSTVRDTLNRINKKG